MNLFTRAAAIIARPRAEWPRIAQGKSPISRAIYLGYVMPLAAIARHLLGLGRFAGRHRNLPGMGVIRMEPGQAVISGAFQYAMQLATIYVDGAGSGLAGSAFRWQAGDRAAAFKVVAYAWTPAWLAGVFNLMPDPVIPDASRPRMPSISSIPACRR